MTRRLLTALMLWLTLFSHAAAVAHTPPAYANQPPEIATTQPFGQFLYTTPPPAQFNPYSPGDEGAFRTTCTPSHLSYNDPILYRGQEGASHLHLFYGNPSTDHNSTFASLRAATNNQTLWPWNKFTCGGGPVNGSGYWHPAIINAQNRVVLSEFVIIYYKENRENANGTSDHSHQIPRGMEMIWGWDMAKTLAQNGGWPAGFGGWKCRNTNGSNANSPYPGLPVQPYLKNADGTATLSCQPGDLLGVEASSPRCWNGLDLTSANGRAHVAHTLGNSHNSPCPSTHPYRIPHFDMIAWFNHEGPEDFKNYRLSSDDHAAGGPALNGQTWHVDWMGGWNQTEFTGWQQLLLGLSGRDEDVRSGVFTNFGNGTGGSQDHLVTTRTVAERTVPIPPDPTPMEPTDKFIVHVRGPLGLLGVSDAHGGHHGHHSVDYVPPLTRAEGLALGFVLLLVLALVAYLWRKWRARRR